MNIRIGNDIKIKMSITDIGNIVVDDIQNARCAFKLSKLQIPNSLFHESTLYTIHGCGNPSYNVDPYNGFTCYTDLHNRGFVDFNHNEYISNCVIDNGYIYASFPAEFLNKIGSYDCIFDVKVKESDWDNDDIHSYRSTYYNSFTLVDDISGLIGSITINAVNKDFNEIYVFTLTNSEFIALNGNYSQILPTADSFSLAQIGTSTKTVNVTGSNKRICFISNKGDLIMSYNSFIIPMSMYKLDNGSYLYLSDYTYSNLLLPVSIINTGTINTICTEYDIKEDDNDDDEDDPIVITNKNSINGSVLKLYGSIISNVLSINGIYSNNAITL